MTRIRTLEFLPTIFQTDTNNQFLSATLDQLVNPPVTKKIQGFIGSKIGYGINAKDYYVTEPNKVRTDYQLEPGVTFLKPNETTAIDFISYPGIIDSLKSQGSDVDNNDALFKSQFYSWDSFTNLDKIINYNQYYWLPDGPPSVIVAASTVYTTNDYVVTALPSVYNIRTLGAGLGANNPTITLLRGGTYNFYVDQTTQFWIQGEPGVTGYSPTQPNLYTRDVYGVINNGASSGVVTFVVPQKDAQDEYNYPGNNPVDVVSTLPFSQINGARLTDIGNIDGVTALDGRTVMFYNTGETGEVGYVSAFYGSTPYDVNDGLVSTQTITATEIDVFGNITVSDTANLEIGGTLTFTGTSFGGIDPYTSNANPSLYATSMTIGENYYITVLGDTDWITAGVSENASIEAEIVGTELRVNSVNSGAFSIGMTLNGAGVTNGTKIIGYDMIATAANGVPTYTVDISQTISLSTISVYDIKIGKIFTCASVPVTGTGEISAYTPVLYYITDIDTGNSTIRMSYTLGGSDYVPSGADTGSMTVYINQGLYEEGYYTDVDDNFYLITFVGDTDDPVLQLTPYSPIPIAEKITAQYGTQYIGRHFVKPTSLVPVQLIPYLSAPLDTLYYQDGTVPGRVGIIKLIESNETNTIDVETDILGRLNYTSPNGVVFTNGLKVSFDGDVIPRSYLDGEYYVEGVGVGIELIPTDSLVVPEPFTTMANSPWDALPYDSLPYDAALNIPSTPDYLTIARNAINKNAWSRSNRWFHIEVINATAEYNNNPEIVNEFAVPANKARRPILEFYPNLKLYNAGTIGKNNVDFVDQRTTDAFNFIEGQQNYYPDVETYTAYTGTIATNEIKNIDELLINQYYEILTLGTTEIETWEQLGAELNQDGDFEIGVQYIIADPGTSTDWATITGDTGPFVKGYTFTAETTGEGTGTGTALKVLFRAASTGELNSLELLSGIDYTITRMGTTQWDLIGNTPVFAASLTPTEVYFIWDLGVGTDWNTIAGTTGVTYKVGDRITVDSAGSGLGKAISADFTATGGALGTGTAVQGDGTVKAKTVTTIQIDADDVVGTLSQGMWINDLIIGEQSRLPYGTRILSIDNTSYQITVYWDLPTDITSGSNASFVACSTDNTDQLLFPGARIVFANDINETIKNKIYVVDFNVTGAETFPVITLTEAADGEILENDQFSVQYGFNNKGKTYYFDGVDYVQAQQKNTVNQAPLFDIFDENGISYGDTTIYNSSTFEGCKLFNYKLGVGVDDPILGFPISYSSINNVGDISFEVSLYTQTFNYISAGQSITSNVNDGYVYNYQDRDTYERMIGWQTAVAPSTQYQVFQFEYTANAIPLVLDPTETIDYTFTVDVPQLNVEDTVWPSLQVFNNNNILELGTDYVVENTATSTIITVYLDQDIDTPIEVLILSDIVSQNAYYTIPINLSNNPFNTDPTNVDIGDIRGQYQSIFDNNPNTEGVMFGSNNYRDLGNLVPWGNRIIQNSASLVMPGAFLRNPKHSLFDSLLFNSREYIKYKTLLVDAINTIANEQKFDPATLLDEAIDLITSVKNQEQSFFWSDMVPNKAPYITNVYTFANQSETSIFPLSRIYDFSTANYYGVLVYLQRTINGTVVTKQLIKDTEYTINSDNPSVTVTTTLLSGDRIIVKEYNQTYGSYVPNTPTKLGLYPAFLPQVVLDTTYIEPTYFIQGHDGSYNKLYGTYDQTLGMLVDFRDQILLEFETRIYNNLKLSNTIPIDLAEIVPGYFRSTYLTYAEWVDVYSKNFLDWVGQNRLNYKTQLYRSNDPWSYNYRDTTLKLDNSKITQGYWRGIYEYLYDTSTPNLTPWHMIGYANKPSWWEDRYGPAPYTSDNLILWTDMQDGIDYNNGTPIVRPLYTRPGLLNILPVDDQGDLRQPLDSVIANYNTLTFQRDWRVGDDAPVEYSYRKSSTYPFDLMRLQALLKPAEFYNLGADIDNYKYNVEFNQYLVNNRNHIVPSEIEIYGNGTAKTSYINWIVDYEKQLGVDATQNIINLLHDLDVRLVYRLAGFSDKSLLKFFVEKGTPDSRNSSLLIPDESYQVLLYENQPLTKLVYSGVIVQKLSEGYSVFGNNQTSAYFKILKPILNGAKERITVQDTSVDIAKNYYAQEDIVPYGTIFYTPAELSQFLMSYGAWLEANGAIFDDQIQNIPINWNQMVAEFLYWTQVGWENGSVVTLNPAAGKLTIDKENQIVQPLTYNQTNFVLNNNLYPIQNKDLNIFRSGTKFSVTPLNEGDAVAYGQFNLSSIEHGIVFQNETLFSDTIYNLVSGLRQIRIYVRGTKSGEWNGTLFASGFIYNQDNIEQWNPELKYTKGSIVKYKNKFFTALKIVQPSQKFKEEEWKETDYDEIQKGLLPNSSTRSYESALYYNTDEANLEKDADLLSFSLIGFRPRDYMASADLTDITQVNVYKNMIKEKGTLNALKAFKGANLPQGGIDYDIYENWAILQGTLGGTLNGNFVELQLNESKLTGNPSIIGVTDGERVQGAQQLVPLYKLFNYGRPIANTNILPLVDVDLPSSLYPDAGYVNLDDVKMSAYYYSNLPSAVNKNNIIVPIDNLYVRDYVWLADYQSSWQILTPISAGQVIQIRSNLNGTCVVTFKENHNLNQYDIFAIINFDSSANGYYVASDIINPREILITLTLPGTTRILTGQGVGLRFNSQRVAEPGDIKNLPLTDSEFSKNTVWVDENNDGSWAVYRKDINYAYDREFQKEVAVTFGSSVAYTQESDFLFGDSGLGKVYRYQYEALTDTYEEDQVLTQDTSFGTTIVHEQNIFAISQPTGTPKVFLYTVNNTTVTDDIILYQEIDASDVDANISNFGTAIALSGDLEWLFISDYDTEATARNNVQVYRKLNELAEVNNVTSDLVSGKTYRIATVGSVNWTSLSDEPIANEEGIYFIYNGNSVLGSGGFAYRCDYEHCATISNGETSVDKFGHSLSTNYYGTTLVVGAPNVDDGAIENYGESYIYDRLVQNILINQPYDPSTPAEFTLAWSADPSYTTVTKNGIVVDSADYSISSTTLSYEGVFDYGDIITVSGNEFVLVQTLTNEQTPRIGVQFGYSVDTNTLGAEILVGAPFYLDSRNQEGGVFRYTYGGARFGMIASTQDVAVTTTRQLLINGYLVSISAGNAAQAAADINEANIINVEASAVNNRLMISLVNNDLGSVNQKLLISATDIDTLSELGLSLYTQTQIIQNPHAVGPSQFGSTVKFNEFNSVAISAPVGTRFAETTFDFIDDENYNNDTIFDNNATSFKDKFNNAGAVYTYDYLSNYNESLLNIGNYTYAQSTNSQSLVYGSQPRYGVALDWYDNKIVIGSPDYRPDVIDGQVVVYTNTTGITNWHVYRQTNPVVDVNRIENIQIFSAETNNTLINLDYIDPLQGKILGAVRQNIDVISNIDPAGYNNNTATKNLIWGDAQVGTIWFDTSNIRYLNYHQNDNVYNASYWGKLFPGSDVAVYSWVSSNVPPTDYQGPGIPKDVASYSVQTIINSSNTISPVYYFWVRNSGIVFTNKSLADFNIASYIADPQASGISYLTPLAQDAVALYNCKSYINANDSVLHIGTVSGQQDNPAHQEFDLIRTDYPEDFLPGVPAKNNQLPESLYDRLLDSICGVDEQGAVVPDPFLPKAVQSGVQARPRQTFFYNRYRALQNYLQYANTIMALFPISELKSFNFLNETGTYYDTRDFWEYINWWAVGYDNNTKSILQVPIYSDLATLSVANGTIVTVSQNSNGVFEVYRYDGDGVWTRIGLQNGTIRFKTELYDYDQAGYGFGGTFYDTDAFDEFPSEPTRWIMRALNEQIYTDELLIYRNKSLILLFEYIQEETVENQNYLPWLNKTSLVDVSHKVRELLPLQNYVSDNEEFLEGYVNETKPYHVVIKEFLFDYTGGDVYPGTLTDFDLPATYDATIEKFVSPQLVYQNVSSDYQFLPDSPVWQAQQYQEWFNNHGVSLTGQENFPIATLESYITLASDTIIVDNPQGFPINGTFTIGTEKISYASVDKATGLITGITRGVDQTTVADHLPGAQIYMNLPGVLLLDGGRNYANPPRIIASIDTNIYPEPIEEATFEAIMSLDTLVGITITNPGKGYAVLPEIVIDPADVIYFNSANVNIINNTIDIYAPALNTGDLVKYFAGDTNIDGVASDQYYYINVLDSNPTTIIALYTTYADALHDTARVRLLSQGSGSHYFEYGARAVAISSSYPVRENNITIRFDRTTYDTQVTEWAANTFYGSEFIDYTLEASSSSQTLWSAQPDINRMLASAQGTPFPIASVTNDRQLTWSGFERTVTGTTANSELVLSYTSSLSDEFPSGSTVGFTVGMPIKFTGDVGTDIVANTTYYVSEVVDLEKFKISATESGSSLTLATFTSTGMSCYTAQVTNTAVISTNYEGIRTITETSSVNNAIRVPVNPIGLYGTDGLYTGVPVIFTGNVFGGLTSDTVYYVTSVLGNEYFTISTEQDPVTVRVLQTNAANQIVVQNTNGLNVNDPIVFDSMSINGVAVDTFGNIARQTIYYVKTIGINVITISTTEGGSTFTTGVVPPSADNYCFITSQTGVVQLTTATGSATMSISLPVSPGQVDGQRFTFYPTSDNFADITGANITYGNLLSKTIEASLNYTDPVSNLIYNKIALDDSIDMYVNIPFTVDSNIGGLVTGKTYYAYDINDIQVYCSTTTGSSLVYNADFNASGTDIDQMDVTLITSGTGTIYPGTLVTGTGVEQNTYVLEQLSGTPGGVGSYRVSTEYPLPVSLTGVSSNTGIITVDVLEYNTDMIYENMPVVFTEQGLGGLLTDFTYYVRHIINSTQFTVSVYREGASVSVTTSNGSMLATGSPAPQVYLKAEDLITGDDYIIKNIGDTDWANVGVTSVFYDPLDPTSGDVVAGEIYIINDVPGDGVAASAFWSAVVGSVITVEQNDILYANNSTSMSSTVQGTAYKATFTATGAGDPGDTGTVTVVLSADTGPATLDQEILEDPTLDIGYMLGGYYVLINDGGVGFTLNNTLTISGDLLGGTSPANDLTLTVSKINSIIPGEYSWSIPVESDGTITEMTASGTPTGSVTYYYLKVTGSNTFKVYSDPLMQVPVSGLDFPYDGYTQTNIASAASTVITLEDATGLAVNDAIIFTGLDATTLLLTEGQAYYITSVSSNDITVSEEPGGSDVTVVSGGVTFSAGLGPLASKPGSFMLLPEPFAFNPSIVRYNNRLWVCVVSNNDSEFKFGKWELLNSGDRRLNALDRVIGYYQPDSNMPGRDLTQLFTGLVYPNTTYLGNNFDPNNQYPVDTILRDTEFGVTNVNLPAVTFNGTNYVAPANLPNYAAVAADIEVSDDWYLSVLANQTLSFTDITRGPIYMMTSTNSPTALLKSNDAITWSANGYLVPYDTAINEIEFFKERMIAAGLQLNSVIYHNGKYIAVGKNIITTTDTSMWYERFVFEDPTDKIFYDVAYVEAPQFTGYIAVGANGFNGIIYSSTDGIEWTDVTPTANRVFYSVVSAFDKIIVVGADKIILTTTDTNVWVQESTGSGTYKAISYADDTLVLVGNTGLVSVSTDGSSYTDVTTGITENLNNLIYVESRDEWTIVGQNNTVLQTSDITAGSVTWDNTHIFSVPTPEYTIQGDPFQAGYGPEEMVPGIVSDQLTMIVNTRAGTNWPATEYAHVGYSVVSLELDLSDSNTYSFNNAQQTPAYINVFKLTDGLSVTLYETLDYTIDWINKEVTLVTPLISGEELRIDVYEVGNGDQLVKTDSDAEPFELNAVTGLYEITLDCNYSAPSYNGGGIIIPDSYPISTIATETESGNDYITVDDVTDFTLNGEIYFTGSVFGGIVADTSYYVKSINTVRSTITISATLVAGIAGPILPLSTDSGSMTLVIQRTSGQFYTEPAVFHNGSLLTSGLTNYVIATSSSTHAITTFSTDGLVIGQPIVFSNTIFGGIDPLTTYYVYTIESQTEFTISDGVNPIYLTDAAGSAIFVTNDYAAMLADNQINAKIVFASPYGHSTDYISYSFFGPSEPLQYGYTIPQTQQFLGQTSSGPYDLNNYLGGDNPTNAIVELNGLRVNPSEYTIDFAFSTITFNSLVPSTTDTIAVTTFNDTERQYLFTTEYDTSTKQVSPVQYVNNTITFSVTTVEVTTTIAHGLDDNDVVRIDGVAGSYQLNNQVFIVEKVDDYTVKIYEYVPGTPYTGSAPITEVSTYSSGGYLWKLNTWVLENNYVTSSTTVALSVSDVSGLVADTPVYFTEFDPATGIDITLGDPLTIPELIAGQKYYIKEINEFTNEFTITDTQGGDAITLTDETGPISIRVTQWQQTNVDRLWVTVNGYRVASSNLRLNDSNEVSILTEVLPGDDVVITSMMPSETPDRMVYIQTVSTEGDGAVYRANSETRTWLTQALGEFDETVHVYDINRLTNRTTQGNTTPIAVDGYHEIGLNANRFDILFVRILNTNPARYGYIDQDYISIRATSLGPFALIQEGTWIEAGDSLVVTIILGNLIYINGEYMKILDVDLDNQTLNVQRGAQGSMVNVYVPKYSTVYSILDENKMSEINYNTTWNPIPGIYNATEGDPLQIAETSAARFLRVDIT